MKKITLLILSLFLMTACSQRLLNISDAHKQVREYYEGGQYGKEIDDVVGEAIEKLEKIPIDNNSAAVFDIDETALDNYPVMKSMDFGDISGVWEDWTYSARAKAIPQVKKIYDWFVNKGVKIYFITGRNGKYCEATRKNLIEAGYSKFDTLICRGKEDSGTTALQYKSVHRANLVKKGAKIIANVGDQFSDSEGGNSGLVIKVPNYLYKID